MKKTCISQTRSLLKFCILLSSRSNVSGSLPTQCFDCVSELPIHDKKKGLALQRKHPPISLILLLGIRKSSTTRAHQPSLKRGLAHDYACHALLIAHHWKKQLQHAHSFHQHRFEPLARRKHIKSTLSYDL